MLRHLDRLEDGHSAQAILLPYFHALVLTTGPFEKKKKKNQKTLVCDDSCRASRSRHELTMGDRNSAAKQRERESRGKEDLLLRHFVSTAVA